MDWKKILGGSPYMDQMTKNLTTQNDIASKQMTRSGEAYSQAAPFAALSTRSYNELLPYLTQQLQRPDMAGIRAQLAPYMQQIFDKYGSAEMKSATTNARSGGGAAAQADLPFQKIRATNELATAELGLKQQARDSAAQGLQAMGGQTGSLFGNLFGQGSNLLAGAGSTIDQSSMGASRAADAALAIKKFDYEKSKGLGSAIFNLLKFLAPGGLGDLQKLLGKQGSEGGWTSGGTSESASTSPR